MKNIAPHLALVFYIFIMNRFSFMTFPSLMAGHTALDDMYTTHRPLTQITQRLNPPGVVGILRVLPTEILFFVDFNINFCVISTLKIVI